MKNRFCYLGIIATALIFLASLTGIAYASWVVDDDTNTHVSTTSLDIEILTNTNVHDPQYPGADITRDIAVYNSGDAPVFVRIKTVGSFIDAEGNSIEDTQGYITVVYDSTDWKDGEDGYWYLRGVLAPGETSASCIESITLSESIGSEYAGYTATVTPQAEALQITSSAVMTMWGKTYEFMEARSPEPRDVHHTSIIFIDPTTGFAFIPDTKDIYPGAKDLTPGESITHFVTLANAYSEAVAVAVSSGTFAPTEHTALFAQHATLTITDESGKQLFNGPAAGSAWDAFTQTVVLEPETETTWEISLTIHHDAPNTLQGIETNILSWDLRAEKPDDPTPPTPTPTPTPTPSPGGTPTTGDTPLLIICALAACISGMILLVLTLMYRKHRKEENPS